MRPEAKNGPSARSRTLRSARQAAMRPEAANGPLTLSTSRAIGRNLGLGQESCVPPGPRLGPLDVSRPSASDGHARIPAEQNWLRCPLANPRVHLCLLAPCYALQLAALRSSPHNGAAMGRLADARARRWVDAPPSSGSSTEPYPSRSRRPRSSVDDRRGGRWGRRGPSRQRAGQPMGGRVAVERLLGRALPSPSWRVSSPQP
jgi:hypothetical protein